MPARFGWKYVRCYYARPLKYQTAIEVEELSVGLKLQDIERDGKVASSSRPVSIVQRQIEDDSIEAWGWGVDLNTVVFRGKLFMIIAEIMTFLAQNH